ncbi:MAG: MogA/MoaB family molybdenum cofactor biosynthesis protein [Planctomycetota bacterium]
MGVHDHKHEAEKIGPIAFVVITTSDSKTLETDITGKLVKQFIVDAGHKVVSHSVVKNDAAAIRKAVEEALAGEAQCVITTGGTGVGKKDVTLEAVTPLFEKTLSGFGELYRHLSFDQIGPSAMLSRAQLGIVKGKVVVNIPGSSGGAEVGMKDLLLPEIAHILSVASK